MQNFDEIINQQLQETKLINLDNNLMLSNKEIEVLTYYHIDYLSCSSLTEILFLIDQELDEDTQDLENISISISERNYYLNTHK